MPASSLRPRSVTEIVDVAFQIYRAHFASLVMCSAIAYLPSLLLRLLVVGDPRRFQSLDASRLGEYAILSLESALVGVVSYALMTAVVTVCASQAYLGEEVDVAAAVRRTLPRFGALVLAGLFVAVMISFGLVLFIAPGIYIAAQYFAVTPAILLEGRGMFAAMTRSTELSKGRKGHVIVTMLLVLLIYFVIFIGLGIMAGLAGGFVVQTILSAIMMICLYPVIPVTIVLLYYDARIQSEGLDIELMAEALGPSAGPALS